MTVDTKKRNARIAEWQKERRITILTDKKELIKEAAQKAGISVNQFIVEAINEKMGKDG